MYFIINITRPPRELTISDLNFTLGPNKAIDLEKVRRRSEIDDSEDLKHAIKIRAIQVRHSNARAKNQPAQVSVEKKGRQTTPEDIASIRSTIQEEIRNEMSKLTQPNANQPDLVAALSKLTEMLAKGTLAQPVASQPEAEEVVPEVEEKKNSRTQEKLLQIHTKSVANMTKNTESQIGYNEQNVEGNLAAKLKELQDPEG